VSSDFDSAEFKHFQKVFKQIQKGHSVRQMIPQKFCSGNIWIIKPVNLNQVAN